MQRRYFLKPTEIGPRVYVRLTDNWLELTVRFIVRDCGIREVKDALSRDILQGLEQNGIELASATFEIVGLPPLRIEHEAS
jgi:small-conductance mechanosensitive channel